MVLKAAKVFVFINKKNGENKFIQNFSSSERVIAYKKAHFIFIKFLNILIVLKDSNSINNLTTKVLELQVM